MSWLTRLTGGTSSNTGAERKALERRQAALAKSLLEFADEREPGVSKQMAALTAASACAITNLSIVQTFALASVVGTETLQNEVRELVEESLRLDAKEQGKEISADEIAQRIARLKTAINGGVADPEQLRRWQNVGQSLRQRLGTNDNFTAY